MQTKSRQHTPIETFRRWLTLQLAAPYAGVTEQTLRNWEKAGHIRFANVTPMGGRGRVLIDRLELDKFIEGFLGAPPSELAMNSKREAAQ